MAVASCSECSRRLQPGERTYRVERGVWKAGRFVGPLGRRSYAYICGPCCPPPLCRRLKALRMGR